MQASISSLSLSSPLRTLTSSLFLSLTLNICIIPSPIDSRLSKNDSTWAGAGGALHRAADDNGDLLSELASGRTDEQRDAGDGDGDAYPESNRRAHHSYPRTKPDERQARWPQARAVPRYSIGRPRQHRWSVTIAWAALLFFYESCFFYSRGRKFL